MVSTPAGRLETIVVRRRQLVRWDPPVIPASRSQIRLPDGVGQQVREAPWVSKKWKGPDRRASDGEPVRIWKHHLHVL